MQPQVSGNFHKRWLQLVEVLMERLDHWRKDKMGWVRSSVGRVPASHAAYNVYCLKDATSRARAMAQWVKGLPCKSEDQSLNPINLHLAGYSSTYLQSRCSYWRWRIPKGPALLLHTEANNKETSWKQDGVMHVWHVQSATLHKKHLQEHAVHSYNMSDVRASYPHPS